MALSELDMMNLWAKQLTGYKSQWERLFGFGYAVEAEGQKQDTELIRQLVEELENSHATLWEEEDDPERPAHAAIAAGRARLEGKP